MKDALIVGVVMASSAAHGPRGRCGSPGRMGMRLRDGTGHRYWLDCVAGFAVPILTALLLFRKRPAACPRATRDRSPTRVNQLDRVEQEYTGAAREILRRSMQGVARTS